MVDSVTRGRNATDFNFPHVILAQDAIVASQLCIFGCNQDASSQIIFCYMSIDYLYSSAN